MQFTSTNDLVKIDKRREVLVAGLPVLMSGHYSLYQIVWMRYAIHLVAMVLWLGPRRAIGLLRTRRPKLQSGRGLLMLAMPAVWKTPSLQDALVMATIGLVGLGLLWVLDRVCELTPASTLAAFSPLQLVCDILLTLMLGGAGIGHAVLAGFALVGGLAVVGLGISLTGRYRQPMARTKSELG